MRELRFLTRAEDGALLIEEPGGFERFRLPVDDALRSAMQAPTAQPSAPTATPTPPASGSSAASITPREIQVRVRAGESPQSVADEQGITLERVMRFAGPVVAERLRITDEARRARAHRPGRDDADPAAAAAGLVVVFGETVDARFAAHGVDATGVEWDSHRREDGEWIVFARWSAGEGTAFEARWLFHRASRSVSPLDDTAVDLLSDRPIRPVTLPPVADAHVTAPPLQAGVIAFPPFPDAHTGPIARVEEVFDQEDTRDLPRSVPPFVPATAASDIDFDEPPLPLAISDGEGRPEAASPLRAAARLHSAGEEEKAARARIPSWDDILLGVRRKDD